MSHTPPPVADWATDFDHTHPDWTNDPYPIWDALRGRCPVASSGRFEDGAHLPVTWDAVREIAYDTEHFSSRRVIVRRQKINPLQSAAPITSDPPDHRAARMPLLPPFNPAAIDKLEAGTRELCHRLIDGFIAQGACCGATDYAQHIPTRVIAKMLGLNEDDGDLFRRWIKLALQDGIHDPKAAMQAIVEMAQFFGGEIARRRAPGFEGDDLICYVMRQKDARGNPVSDQDIIGTLRLLLIAGIDTTWSAIGASLWHLATHPEDRRRLQAEPALWTTGLEELLRAYSPVTMAREVVKDVTVGGCPMKPGAQVLLSFPAANRDPAKFADADKVILDREDNAHAAFGLGIHRCVGSNLARMELRVALQVFLERIPEFSLDATRPTTWSEGTVRGPRDLPLLFGAA